MTATRPYNAVYEALRGTYSEETIRYGLEAYGHSHLSKRDQWPDVIVRFVENQCKAHEENLYTLAHMDDPKVPEPLDHADIKKTQKEEEAKREARLRRIDKMYAEAAAELRRRLSMVQEELYAIEKLAAEWWLEIEKMKEGT